MLERYGEKRKLENTMEVSQKRKVESPYDPTIHLLGIIQRKFQLERYMHFNVHSSTINNSQDMKAT